tara:strand:+ start:515 stop:715 length:201 start_codon:yes stop_codon:yes gene_type:complete
MSEIANLGSTRLKPSKNKDSKALVGVINHNGIAYLITKREEPAVDEATGKVVRIAEYSLGILPKSK